MLGSESLIPWEQKHHAGKGSPQKHSAYFRPWIFVAGTMQWPKTQLWTDSRLDIWTSSSNDNKCQQINVWIIKNHRKSIKVSLTTDLEICDSMSPCQGWSTESGRATLRRGHGFQVLDPAPDPSPWNNETGSAPGDAACFASPGLRVLCEGYRRRAKSAYESNEGRQQGWETNRIIN